jgi:hypothetical protein
MRKARIEPSKIPRLNPKATLAVGLPVAHRSVFEERRIGACRM